METWVTTLRASIGGHTKANRSSHRWTVSTPLPSLLDHQGERTKPECRTKPPHCRPAHCDLHPEQATRRDQRTALSCDLGPGPMDGRPMGGPDAPRTGQTARGRAHAPRDGAAHPADGPDARKGKRPTGRPPTPHQVPVPTPAPAPCPPCSCPPPPPLVVLPAPTPAIAVGALKACRGHAQPQGVTGWRRTVARRSEALQRPSDAFSGYRDAPPRPGEEAGQRFATAIGIGAP